MDALEPLISTTTAGPLGVMHLPRLWLKILLDSLGRLPEGYRAGEGGFDSGLCDAIGIDSKALVAFVRDRKPDYLTLERWVKEHATRLTPSAVAAWNLRAAGGKMTIPERIAAWHERFGITDPEYTYAAALNNLDDWAGIHARLTETPKSS